MACSSCGASYQRQPQRQSYTLTGPLLGSTRGVIKASLPQPQVEVASSSEVKGEETPPSTESSIPVVGESGPTEQPS